MYTIVDCYATACGPPVSHWWEMGMKDDATDQLALLCPKTPKLLLVRPFTHPWDSGGPHLCDTCIQQTQKIRQWDLKLVFPFPLTY